MDTLDGHGVVEGRTATADRPMTLQVDQVGRSSLSEPLVLQLLVVADPEGDVNARSVSGLDTVNVVALRGVDVVVEKGGSLSSLGLQGWDATLLNHVGQVEATHVDWPAGRRIVERIWGLSESVPVA